MLVSLDEHCNFLGGFAFKSQDLKDPDGIPVVKIKNVNNKVVKMDDVQFFSEEKMNEKLNYHWYLALTYLFFGFSLWLYWFTIYCQI